MGRLATYSEKTIMKSSNHYSTIQNQTSTTLKQFFEFVRNLIFNAIHQRISFA